MSRADAAALVGLLAGTLQLARATPDRAESDAILEAGIRAALGLGSADNEPTTSPRNPAALRSATRFTVRASR